MPTRTPRTPFVAGNWKMNLDRSGGLGLAKLIAGEEHPGVDEGCAPPFVYLEAVRQALGDKVLLGAQDCYFESRGAFTGEVSAEMLADVGCRFCLVGHSERRHVLREPSDLIAKKAAAVLRAGLVLVHCVGETLEEREADRTNEVVDAQLAELDGLDYAADRVVVAYEPVWAIGTGKTAAPDQAQEVHAHVRGKLREGVRGGVRVIYGGSVKPENADDLLRQPDVDGALVGGASLKADQFLPILRAAQRRAEGA